MQWVAAAQPPSTAPTTAYVVPSPAPAVVVIERPARQSYSLNEYDGPASAVYYVGPYRNAPYQSGIFP